MAETASRMAASASTSSAPQGVPPPRGLDAPAPPLLVAVVSYSSMEAAFADALLAGASACCAGGVVLSVGDRLYSGAPEDEAGLAALSARHPGVRVARYAVPDALLDAPVVLHNRAREAGVLAARQMVASRLREVVPPPRPPTDDAQPPPPPPPPPADASDFWVLLLDGDEVPDGPRVAAWWAAQGPRLAQNRGVLVKLANHWLFLHPRLVAEEAEDSVLLAHASMLDPGRGGVPDDVLTHPRERDGIILAHEALTRAVPDAPLAWVAREVRGLDDRPMFWHASWVRGMDARSAQEGGPGQRASFAQARAALHAKVEAWGHRADRDWHALIDASIDALEAGQWPETDFVHGHQLRLLPAPGAPIFLPAGMPVASS